jgi:hypothetical protein
MWPLETVQQAFAATLAHGPAHCPPDLFAGPPERVLLGLKAHANTVSHARLVALEESFPLLREEMGTQAFHAMARRFVERPDVVALPLADIGCDLPAFLREEGAPAALVDLARVERAWLGAFHAAEAAPLELADLAGMPETDLLALELERHPAKRLLTLAAPPAPALRAVAPGLEAARILLLTRAADAVRLSAATPGMSAALAALVPVAPLAALLQAAARAVPEAEPTEAFLALVNAGALIPANPPPEPRS